MLGRINASGIVSLLVATGDILNGNGVQEINVQAPEAFLAALEGRIGTDDGPITFDVPLISGTATIHLVSAVPPVIQNLQLAEVDSRLQVRDISLEQARAAVGASIQAAIEGIGYIDWAGLDPDIRLVDCLEPCIKLPPDQIEDEELAWLREPTQMLMIRTVNGVQLIPVYNQPIAFNSIQTDGSSFDSMLD